MIHYIAEAARGGKVDVTRRFSFLFWYSQGPLSTLVLCTIIVDGQKSLTSFLSPPGITSYI